MTAEFTDKQDIRLQDAVVAILTDPAKLSEQADVVSFINTHLDLAHTHQAGFTAALGTLRASSKSAAEAFLTTSRFDTDLMRPGTSTYSGAYDRVATWKLHKHLYHQYHREAFEADQEFEPAWVTLESLRADAIGVEAEMVAFLTLTFRLSSADDTALRECNVLDVQEDIFLLQRESVRRMGTRVTEAIAASRRPPSPQAVSELSGSSGIDLTTIRAASAAGGLRRRR